MIVVKKWKIKKCHFAIKKSLFVNNYYLIKLVMMSFEAVSAEKNQLNGISEMILKFV